MKFAFPLCLIICLPFFADATVIFVDDNASPGGDGSSWSNAHKYLQDALSSASSGDEIRVAEGTYKPDRGTGKTPGDRTESFNLVSGVDMNGGFLGTEVTGKPLGENNQTILSGEIDSNSTLWSIHVLSAKDITAKVSISGFRITKGNANGENVYNFDKGSGAFLVNSKISFRDCFFSHNQCIGTSANTVFVNSTTSATFLECVFAFNDGGIYNDKNVTIVSCNFRQNRTGAGAAIKGCPYSYTAIKGSIFELNEATSHGGALSFTKGKFDIFHSVFSKNKALSAEGGAIDIDRCPPSTISNCIFVHNEARNGGGAICLNSDNLVRITQSTFVRNQTQGRGGASLFYHEDGSNVLPLIHNSIFWDNSYDLNTSHGITSHGEVHKGLEPPSEWKTEQKEIPERFPGDPDARVGKVFIEYKVFTDGINLLHNQKSVSEVFKSINSSNLVYYDNILRHQPDFIDIENPIGPDNVWLTVDDGLRLKATSLALDAGKTTGLIQDLIDVDSDGDLIELCPFDAVGHSRIQNGSVDLGAFEYGNETTSYHYVEIVINPTEAGTVVGNGLSIEDGDSLTISATPNFGFVFSNWSGDAVGNNEKLTLRINSRKSIVANFSHDANDDDSDGLTNYDEIIVYGTDPTDDDSDNDGLLDKEEISLNSNPLSSDLKMVNHITEKYLINEDSNSTPYTPDWFFLPERGWMWTQPSAYPYFYDGSTNSWLYFKSGHEKPRFYDYGKKEWISIE